MCSDKKATSQLCAMYSFTGILFMGWVGMMITYQPFFITGLENVEDCKSSAFGAMGTFLVTFSLSVAYLCYDHCCLFKYGALATSDADAGGPGMPAGMSDYDVNLEMTGMGSPRNMDVPSSGISSRRGSRASASSSNGGGRRPYSDTPYSDTPVTAAGAPATSSSIHSAPPDRPAPKVLVAGMPRSSSNVSATSMPATGDLLPGFSDSPSQQQQEIDDSSSEEEEEGEWATSSAPEPAPTSGGGPPIDLLS